MIMTFISVLYLKAKLKAYRECNMNPAISEYKMNCLTLLEAFCAVSKSPFRLASRVFIEKKMATIPSGKQQNAVAKIACIK